MTSEKGADGNFLGKHNRKRQFEEVSWGAGGWENKNNEFGSLADIYGNWEMEEKE